MAIFVRREVSFILNKGLFVQCFILRSFAVYPCYFETRTISWMIADVAIGNSHTRKRSGPEIRREQKDGHLL